ETELTEHRVELVVAERQCIRAPLEPLDRGAGGRRQRPCDRDHAAVHVDARDAPAVSDVHRGETRNHTCSAGDVHHSIAPPGPAALDKVTRPRLRRGGNEQSLVELRGPTLELPAVPIRRHGDGLCTGPTYLRKNEAGARGGRRSGVPRSPASRSTMTAAAARPAAIRSRPGWPTPTPVVT